jgi:hypothetical protein
LRNFAHFVRAVHEISRFPENIFGAAICPFSGNLELRRRSRSGANRVREIGMSQSIDLKKVREALTARSRAAWLQAA